MINSSLRLQVAGSYIITNSDFDAFVGRQRTQDAVTMEDLKRR